MIIAELPYVSNLLKETIERNSFELIETENTAEIFKGWHPNIIGCERAVENFKMKENCKLFTNSENAIGWMAANLSFTNLPRQIDLFKNKVKFREFMASRHPNYFFREIAYEQLAKIDIASFPPSFVVKPAVGFFSMGVYLVHNHEEWPKIVSSIQSEIEQVKNIYPTEVFNATNFIVEALIEGKEYAFDAYFNQQGEPVILNIFHHPFSSSTDVSDRVYLSSEEIVMGQWSAFTNWLAEIGKEANLRNFPLHVEVRVNERDEIQPIEINPLRFGGFCTTADCTWFSYGINPYEYFFNEQQPNWAELFSTRKGKLYSLLVLNNSTGLLGEDIKGFDYEKIAACLEHPLEIRPVDFKQFPLFGFIFAETRMDNYAELDYLLQSDLREFIIF